MAGQLGELFVKVRADTGEFDRNIDSAEKQTKQFSAKSAVALAGLAVAAVAAFRKISAAVQQSIQAYGRQVDAEVGLQAALRATGQEADRLFPIYADLASEIQSLTTVGDEAALEMITLATNMGIAEDQMEETIKGAIGLADAFGIGTQQALRGIANALQGNFEQLQRYIPALRTAETEAEKLAIVQEAMANGFEVSQARAETAFGALQQYQNAVGDLQEQLGQNIAEGIEPFVRSLTGFVSRVTDAISRTREFRNILEGLQEGAEQTQVPIENLRAALDRLREAEERIIRTGRERGTENLGRIRQEIALLEQQIALRSQIEEAMRREAAIGEGPMAAAARANREALERQLELVEEIQQAEFDRLSPIEQRLQLAQEQDAALAAEFQALARQRDEVRAQGLAYEDLQATINAVAQRRLQIAEDIAEFESQLRDESVEEEEETWQERLRLAVEADEAERERIRALAEFQRGVVQARRDEEIAGLRELQEEYERTADAILDYLGPTFEALGEALSGVEDGWISLGQTAVRAIATIIRALAREFAARAAGAFATGNIPLGSALASASAAALIASGIVNGLASQIQKAALGADFETSGPQLLMVGDNPGGRERVQVTPLSSPNANGPADNIHVIVNLDGKPILDTIQRASNNGRLLINARSVV